MIRGLHCSYLAYITFWLTSCSNPSDPISPPPVARTVFNVKEAKYAVSRDVYFPYPPYGTNSHQQNG